MVDFTVLNTESFTKLECLVLELYYQNTPMVISPEQTPFAIGRDASDAGLSVNGEFASRKHCAIEFHGGKFVLKDFSRNGTFVQLTHAQTFRIQSEATPLIGNGCFKLGSTITTNDPERILFKVSSRLL